MFYNFHLSIHVFLLIYLQSIYFYKLFFINLFLFIHLYQFIFINIILDIYQFIFISLFFVNLSSLLARNVGSRRPVPHYIGGCQTILFLIRFDKVINVNCFEFIVKRGSQLRIWCVWWRFRPEKRREVIRVAV